ncbi:MAG TPA: carbohydrate-binding family 9-like protein [Verrucomicrobiae bacterium]|nr:carbohydrate-binding family 9-like protein [Verrucomicrobiae bacterium]
MNRSVECWMLWILLIAALLQAPGFIAAADYMSDWARLKRMKPRQYLAQYTSTPIQIDGSPSEAAWGLAPWTEDFADIEGDAKPKPRFRTRAKMLWDDQFFYVAAEMEEPHLWATLTNHDAVIFQDPDFEVFIDPDGDAHDYYEFEINALNTGWDLLLKKPYKDGGPALNEWEIPGLKTAVHLEGTLNNPSDRDRGWSVEIAIPWKVLGEHARRPAPPQESDQWRIGFSRVEWEVDILEGKYRKVPGRKEDNWVWSPQGIIDMHRPEKWGYVQFTRQPVGQARFVPDPAAGARDVLQEIYYAQKDFQKKNRRWAKTLGELPSLSPGLGANLAQPPVLTETAEGYRVTVGVSNAPGKPIQHWHIREDARVWQE